MKVTLVQTISLDNAEFEGQNNAYLLNQDGSPTLVDTGVARPGPKEALERELSTYGYGFEDIENVVLTHWHPDHAGLAGEIQAAGDTTVYAHEADVPIIEQDEEGIETLRDLQFQRFDDWGIPDAKQAELRERLAGDGDLSGRPASVEPLSGGEELTVGGVELKVFHTPGHTAGLVCYEFEADGNRDALVGDTILPKYTPNVGGADVRVEDPLATYIETLRRVADRGYDQVRPGHREIIEDPADRATEIIDHHTKRTERVIDVLREHGPADAWTVSDHLFGDVHGIHILHGPGEAFAHLDHLVDHRVVDNDDNEYYLVDESVDPEDVL